jgi:hypothetical protein
MFAISSIVDSTALGDAVVLASSSSVATQSYANQDDLELAIQAGLSHLQSILDPGNGLLPYFNAWALTSAQANAYGDPSTYREAPANLAFDRHFVSNVAGRTLYALLSGGDVLDAALKGDVVAALTNTVVRSLLKPRNGNWNDLRPENMMVTGLAADPRTYGSQRFDMTYLFNVGAGLRGALALATLTDNPHAKLAGTDFSAVELFEISVHNIRQYYVYGGGAIGGARTYNWETFRNQLGLQGGMTIAATAEKEIASNWSNLWKGWSDPFLIDDLVRYYEATGHQGSLELAKELRDYSFYRSFPVNPAGQLTGLTHSFEVVGEMNAYSRLALVLGDADMMNRVRARYEMLRGAGFTSTGWVPEYFNSGSDVGEANCTVELAETALNFARWGWDQYYDDVERSARAGLLPTQLLDTRFIVNNASPKKDGQKDVAARLYGAFGFPAPYGAVATKKPSHTGGYFTDVSAGAVAGAAALQEAAYQFSGGVHSIYLLFDQDNDSISFVSPYEGAGRITVSTKVAGDVRIRLASGVDATKALDSLASQGVEARMEGRYLRLVSPQVGRTYRIDAPLVSRAETMTVNGRAIQVQWLGDGVAAMSRMGTPMPFFADVGAAVNKPVERAPIVTTVVASAGADLTAVAGSPIQLTGGATVSPTAAATASWSQLSGPGPVTLAHGQSFSTQATFPVAGTYVMRLTARSGSAAGTDDVTIVVSAPQPPASSPPISSPTSPGEKRLPSSRPIEIAFQSGINGYAGARDTTIRYVQWNEAPNPVASGSRANLTSDGTTFSAALLSWNVAQIPAGSVVLSATVVVDVLDPSAYQYEVYSLSRRWNEMEASWSVAENGSAWRTRGALGALDHGIAPVAVTTPQSKGATSFYFTAAGVAAVQQWVEDPAKNFGVIIQDYSAKDALSISSREASDPARRPKLIVSYIPAGTLLAPPFSISAGSDFETQVAGPAVLFGSIRTEAMPADMRLEWRVISGPATATIAAPAAAVTTARFSTPGVYVLRLTGLGAGYATSDDTTVTVLAGL